MRLPSVRCCVAAAVILSAAATPQVSSAALLFSYKEIAVADGTSFNNFDFVRLNESGVVVFEAERTSTGSDEVYTGTGGLLTGVATGVQGVVNASDPRVIDISDSQREVGKNPISIGDDAVRGCLDDLASGAKNLRDGQIATRVNDGAKQAPGRRICSELQKYIVVG